MPAITSSRTSSGPNHKRLLAIQDKEHLARDGIVLRPVDCPVRCGSRDTVRVERRHELDEVVHEVVVHSEGQHVVAVWLLSVSGQLRSSE